MSWPKGANSGKFKTGLKRDQKILLRLSDAELSLIDHFCAKRKALGLKHNSRSDVIVLSVKFAAGKCDVTDYLDVLKTQHK